jgi:DNA-binding MarR family transcriptional regulator
LLACKDHYKTKRFIPGIASSCKLRFVKERKDEGLRIEPPVPERSPRSVGFLISQLGFFSSRGFMEALAPVGIDPKEFLLIRFVAASEGQSQQALAERLGVPASRMVALVDHLEEEGLVERRAHPEDRRIRGLHLTTKGKGVLERAAKIAIDYETQLCAGINREEREQLIDLLQKLQAGQTELGGVHPGLRREPWRNS